MSCKVICELLEFRRLLAAAAPTAVEQYEVELINRARANPSAEAKRFKIDLNEGLPAGTISKTAKQPLAINPYLTDAARKHSKWMIDNDRFSHTGKGGTNPGQRMAAALYKFVRPYTWAENIAYRSSKPSKPDPTKTAAQLHQDLFVDKGISERGHRTNLLNVDVKEIGAGVTTGDFSSFNAVMLTTDFAASGSGSFLTGVAYSDRKVKDKFYTVGEGLAGVTIAARRAGDGKLFMTKSWASGGYSLKLAAGTYTVTASGGGLARTFQYSNVKIGSQNVKRDFVT